MADASGRRTGLGRGLQALLPNAGDQPHAPDPGDWLAASDPELSPRLPAVVESGLDLLQRAMGVDVCAYVHARERGRPRLWLRPGPGAALTPEEWVELGIVAVGAVLGQVRMPRTLTLGRTELLAVPTRGGGSSGVHLLGRSGRGLADHERTVAIHLVQALGEALHGLLPEQEEDGPLDVGAPAPVFPEGAPVPARDASVKAVGVEGAGVVEGTVGVELAGAGAGVEGAGGVQLAGAGAGAGVEAGARVAEAGAVEVIDLVERSSAAAATARWPKPVDLEALVRDAVRASGVRHSELDVRLRAHGGADVIDVAAVHRGDRVRVVLPADPDDPADAANRAASQTVHLLQLIGAALSAVEERAAG